MEKSSQANQFADGEEWPVERSRHPAGGDIAKIPVKARQRTSPDAKNPTQVSVTLSGERCPDPGEVVVTVAHRMILEHELAGERSIAIQRHWRGAIQLLIAKARIAAAAAALLVASKASVASFAMPSFSFAWSRFMVSTASQVTPVISWPAASKLAKWISTGYTLAT